MIGFYFEGSCLEEYIYDVVKIREATINDTATNIKEFFLEFSARNSVRRTSEIYERYAKFST